MRPNDLLKTFVGEMQREYPSAIFRFEYDEEEEMHRIWHTYTDVYSDESFNSAIGKLITNLYVPAEFFDYYIELNVSYVEELKKINCWIIEDAREATIDRKPNDSAPFVAESFQNDKKANEASTSWQTSNQLDEPTDPSDNFKEAA